MCNDWKKSIWFVKWHICCQDLNKVWLITNCLIVLNPIITSRDLCNVGKIFQNQDWIPPMFSLYPSSLKEKSMACMCFLHFLIRITSLHTRSLVKTIPKPLQVLKNICFIQTEKSRKLSLARKEPPKMSIDLIMDWPLGPPLSESPLSHQIWFYGFCLKHENLTQWSRCVTLNFFKCNIEHLFSFHIRSLQHTSVILFKFDSDHNGIKEYTFPWLNGVAYWKRKKTRIFVCIESLNLLQLH